MKVLTVIGNRPQFIKAAAVSPRLRKVHEELLVHTGQHYDDRLSAIFFAELGLPAPDEQLGVAQGTSSSQTARMLTALEPIIEREMPDLVLVYGDTNSTLAGALAAAQAMIPVAHVEAGMRSFDRSMPEELNRVLVDHASSLLLCSSEVAMANLRHESVTGLTELVGDVMVDVALEAQPRARERTDLMRDHGVEPGSTCWLPPTGPATSTTRQRLARLVAVLRAIPFPVLLPLHPRTRARLEATGMLEELRLAPEVRLLQPLGYFELTALLCNARAVLTDSGGLQKEAYLAGVKCITMRPSTEWTETVEQGWNVLVDLDPEAALAALGRERPAHSPRPVWGWPRGRARRRRAYTAGGSVR